MKWRLPRHLTLVAAMTAQWLVLGAVAFAEDTPAGEPRGLIARRCKDDRDKLCAGIEPGGGRLAQCLRGHQAELSEPCKAALVVGKPAAPAPATAPAKAAPPRLEPPAAPPALTTPPASPTAQAAPPAGSALPGESGAMMGMRRTCATEIEKLCKEVLPGQGRLALCLNDHPKELSPGCKKAVNLVVHQMNASVETHQACAGDVEKLCPDLQPGGGRVAFCLGEHAAELSPGCKQQIAAMKAAGKRSPAAK